MSARYIRDVRQILVANAPYLHLRSALYMLDREV